MATKQVYFSNAGVPATGLTLAWSYLKKVSDGTDVGSPPAFTEIGGGWYKFTINPTEKYVGVIDGSGTLTIASERYVPVYFDLYDYLYDVFLTPCYISASDALIFMACITENGQLVTTGLTNCSISVYDSAHTLQWTVTGASNTNGVFIITKSTPGIANNASYYAKVTITLNGQDYISIDTYISLQ